MEKFIFKLKILLKMSITVMITMVLFLDSNILNSVFLYQDEEFVIEEVSSVVVTNRENTQLSGQVIVNDKNIVDSYSDGKVTQLNNVVSSNATNKWVWPTEKNYIITSYYGYRWGRMHGAIDISGPSYGSNIYAANSGVVVTVKGGCIRGNTSCNGSGGNYVVIKHNINNYYTVYMHLNSIKVSVGQTVGSGQVIGTMGNTGNVVPVPTSSNPYAGTHLHFALYIGEPYRGGYTVNPMRLY